MKAMVEFKNGITKIAIVNSSYSRGGVHYYVLSLNILDTFLDFKAGVQTLYNESEIIKLTYIMG